MEEEQKEILQDVAPETPEISEISENSETSERSETSESSQSSKGAAGVPSSKRYPWYYVKRFDRYIIKNFLGTFFFAILLLFAIVYKPHAADYFKLGYLYYCSYN